MKLDFQFSNLLGTVYTQGDLLFSSDGNSLFTPVGNRVTRYDLVNNKTSSISLSHRRNLSCMSLSPNDRLLLSIDEDGRAILTNVRTRTPFHHFSFRGPVSSLAFGPLGDRFAVCIKDTIELWQVPSIASDGASDGQIDFSPFTLQKTFSGHHDTVTRIEWSSDGRFLLSCSNDLTARVWSTESDPDFEPTVLAGHRAALVLAWFSPSQENVYTLSRDGALFAWGFESQSMTDARSGQTPRYQWRILQRHYLCPHGTHVKCAARSSKGSLIATSFSNGTFALYDEPDFTAVQSLSISQNGFHTVTFNKSGEWLAFGGSEHGQLLVWEWQSESFILKQQGHHDALTDLAWSPDGQWLVSTADDGKVKLWDVQSGHCVVTFNEHSSTVTACAFAKKGRVFFTSSLDGSVRAWDLNRYRNFRTFSAPDRVSFNCMAVDNSSEVVCAGSLDTFDVFLWSVQTGQLLDQLSGHEGPVVALSFTNVGDSLISGSWDRTARIWSIFGRSQSSEPLQLQSEILAICCSPNSRQVAIATLDGHLTFWSIAESAQEGGIDNRRDVSGGRKMTDRRVAANVAGTKAFTSIAYSTDGSSVLAGGHSKFICLYDVLTGVLLKKFTISSNLSFSGTQEYLNSQNLTEGGPLELLNGDGDSERQLDKVLPGAQKGGAAARQVVKEIRITGAAFSPLGSAFCVASTEGLLVYSLEGAIDFDPFELDIDITPTAMREAVESGDGLRALVIAFRLNEEALVQQVFMAIPFYDLLTVVQKMPAVYINRTAIFLAKHADSGTHLEVNLKVIEAFLSCHGKYLKANSKDVAPCLRGLEKSLNRVQHSMTSLAEDNFYRLQYILAQP